MDLLDDTLLQSEGDIARSRDRSAAADLPPAEVPGFEIVRSLGSGAFGSVWLAREANTGKHVAVKFYSHQRGLDWSLLNREVEKLAVLYTSRNIVSLLEVGWSSAPPYYVMEYLENGSLGERLAQEPLSVAESVRIGKDVAKALVHAHGAGILHCDLKPSNVLLGSNEDARLCDFGQSRLSDEQNPALGTLFYMAPEQADLKAVPDARWDVYALGALIYEMLCGSAPFRTPENEVLLRSAGSLEEKLSIYRRVVRQSPRPTEHRKHPHVDRRLADIVDRCLNTDPTKRFSNAQAVLDRLERRDRYRASRPWIAVGLLGPVLLLIAMIIIVSQIMTGAVESTRREVTQRALESDMLSARILSNSLSEEVTHRTRELQAIASDAELASKIIECAHKPYAERGPLITVLKNHKDAHDQRIDDKQHDTSWFLCDANGNQIWRSPFNRETIDKNWAHRDYFHGRNTEYAIDDLPEDLQPIDKPHVSLAFRSRATNKFMFAISVPVRDGDKVVGVLARTTHLDELRQQFGRRLKGQNDDVNRFIAIVDYRDWILRDHTGLTPELLAPKSGAGLEELRLDDSVVERFRPHVESNGSEKPLEIRDDNYVDPLGEFDPERLGGRRLAAVAEIKGTGWAVIVQESRKLALQPVDEMQEELTSFGLWAIVISFALIALIWTVVIRAMSRR